MLSEVNFQKSKCITESQLPEVKMFIGSRLSDVNISPEVKNYHWKSTFESQKLSPEVNFQKSKNVTGSRFPKIKKLILFLIFLILFKIYVF